jgi:hypothetical protein
MLCLARNVQDVLCNCRNADDAKFCGLCGRALAFYKTRPIVQIGTPNLGNAEFDIKPRYEHMNNPWPDMVRFSYGVDAVVGFPGHLSARVRTIGPMSVEILFNASLRGPALLKMRFIGDGWAPRQNYRPALAVSLDGNPFALDNILPNCEESDGRPIYRWTGIELAALPNAESENHTLALSQQNHESGIDFISVLGIVI